MLFCSIRLTTYELFWPVLICCMEMASENQVFITSPHIPSFSTDVVAWCTLAENNTTEQIPKWWPATVLANCHPCCIKYIKNPKQNTHLDGSGIQNEHIHQNVKWLHSVNLTVHAVTGRSKQCWCKDSACLATLPHNQAGDSGPNHSIHQNGSQISEEMSL